jgi:hypothetical protein
MVSRYFGIEKIVFHEPESFFRGLLPSAPKFAPGNLFSWLWSLKIDFQGP